jgi:hypothetical protein
MKHLMLLIVLISLPLSANQPSDCTIASLGDPQPANTFLTKFNNARMAALNTLVSAHLTDLKSRTPSKEQWQLDFRIKAMALLLRRISDPAIKPWADPNQVTDDLKNAAQIFQTELTLDKKRHTLNLPS